MRHSAISHAPPHVVAAQGFGRPSVGGTVGTPLLAHSKALETEILAIVGALNVHRAAAADERRELERYADAMERGGEPVAMTQRTVVALAQAHERLRGETRSLAPLKSVVASVADTAKALARRFSELTVYRTLTLVNAAAADNADEIKWFADSISEAARIADDVLTRLHDEASGVLSDLETDRNAPLRDIELVIGFLQNAGSDWASHHEANAERARAIAAKSASIRAGVTDLVKKLQFQDAMRQRLEHIAALLEPPDASPLRSLCRTLRRAAAGALAQDAIREGRDGIAPIAKDIASLRKATIALGEEAAEIADDKHLEAQRAIARRFSQGAERLTAARALITGEEAELSRFRHAIGNLILEVDSLDRIARDVFRLAVNADIIARRSGAAGGPVGVIAREVRTTASASRDAVSALKSLIVEIDYGVDTANRDQTSSELTMKILDEAVDAMNDAQDAFEKAAADAEERHAYCRRRFASMVNCLDEAANRRRALDAWAEGLATVAPPVLTAPPFVSEEDRARITTVATMEGERRALHDVFGAKLEPIAEASLHPKSPDDLDDIIF